MLDLRQDTEARSVLERDGEYLLPVYARYPVAMERSEGVYLFDSSGNRYLDLMAGLDAVMELLDRLLLPDGRGASNLEAVMASVV